MRKFILFFTVVSVLLVTSGCTDTRYMAERRFWHAEREAAKIFAKAPSGKLSDEQLAKVIGIYEEVAKDYPLEKVAAQIHFSLSRIYFSQGKFDIARRELTRIVQNFSADTKIAPQAYFGLGNIYEAEKKWPQAKEEYEKIIDLYPLSTLGLTIPMYLVQHYQQVDDQAAKEAAYEKGVKNYMALIDKYNQTSVAPVIKDHLASLHILMGKPQAAIDLWDETIKNYSQGTAPLKAYLSKAGVYENQLKDFPKAIGVYNEFLEKFPNTPIDKDVRYRLGRLYLVNGQVDKAKEAFYSLIDKYPDQTQLLISSYSGLAQCYRKEANTEKVVEMYDTIRTRFPDTTAAMAIPFLTAQYYKDIKYAAKAETAFTDAITEYQKILTQKKTSEKAKDAVMHFLALSYLKNLQWDEALPLLRQLIEKHPQNPSYLMDIAAVHRNLQDTDSAVKTYEELIKRYPNNAFLVKFAKTQIDILEKGSEN
ncbi:MAG: tetratricopeptide repeat protein [Candidatus Omnitrophica bacterium]|nr:tetratricopeptide repeat protein [Candidatus Omnitrophota bacterium]